MSTIPSQVRNETSLAPRTKKVLVVEDEPQWQKFISITLKSLDKNIEVCYEESAQGALRLLQVDPSFDMVIADHYLEGNETGIDLWQGCQDKNLEVPFILVSGLEEEKFWKLMADSGNNQPLFISKPFEIKHFREILDWRLRAPKKDQAGIKKRIFFYGLMVAAILVGTTLSDRATIQPIPSRQITSIRPFEPATKKIDQLIRPELKRQIARILERADEMNALQRKEARSSGPYSLFP